MTSELLLGIRLNPTDSLNVIKVDNIDLTEKVANLRNHTAAQTNLPNESFDLIYGGCLLENESILDAYGLKNGSMVHVVKRIDPEKEEVSASSSSGPTVEVLAQIFKSIVGNSRLKNALRRLTRKDEFLKNIVESTPGLKRDAVAVSLLMDPDLIVHFNHRETLKKISKLHPALMDAAQHIASAVHEEAHNFAANPNASMDSSSSSAGLLGQSYSLDNLSDDDDMGEPMQPSAQDQQLRNNALNASILEAFARARRSNSAGNASDGSGSSSSTSGTNSNSGGVITFEMFNQAMQQAFASTPAMNDQGAFAPPPPPATPAAVAAPQNASATDIQTQISIMHEVGLLNDAINLQALQITNGDVQAAIELVLNGFGN